MFLAVSPACRAVSEMFDVSHSEFEEKDTSSCLQAQHLLIPVRIRTSRATVAIRAEDRIPRFSSPRAMFLFSLFLLCRRHAVGLDDKSSG